jgi:hypothetical protein
VLAFPTPGSENADPLTTPEVPFVRADANGDGVVDSTDLEQLSQFLSGVAPLPACLDRLDVNDDGEINVSDLNYLVETLFEDGPPIPAPHPSPGSDPSIDDLICFSERS